MEPIVFAEGNTKDFEDAIKNGKSFPGNEPDTTVFFLDKVKVVVNSFGDVVSVVPQ